MVIDLKPGISQQTWLHVAEVELYNSAGRVAAVQATLSTTDHHPASNALDGNTGTFCHTGGSDPAPSLTVKYVCPGGATSLSRVIVTNRQDSQYQGRLNNFRLRFLNVGGSEDRTAFQFLSARPVYNIPAFVNSARLVLVLPAEQPTCASRAAHTPLLLNWAAPNARPVNTSC